ncbi:calcium-binding protein [Oryzibacter oryziterrae]|uniref:calcium-binding protein n=1 Tax=Oryzibacter oryziterrae TaxID=2766474 RepID=UPI001F166ECD|nr:calcium-binding protein [Oryzibacter oryziterrae]
MAFTIVNGTNGADQITVGASQSGNFDIRAKGGDDVIKLLRSDDLGGGHIVDAGSGNDQVLNRYEGNNVIKLGSGNDTYVSDGFTAFNESDVVFGHDGNDTFIFATFQSTFYGGNQNDTFISVGWQNVINGGFGTDTISYAHRHEDFTLGGTAVTIDLQSGQVATGTTRIEHLSSIENAVGSERDDLIFGTTGANNLKGVGGNDGIDAGAGNDTIEGGNGNDELIGGAGADKFVFSKATFDSGDQIDDFNPAQGDTIQLKHGTAFGSLRVGDFLDSGTFVAGANPVVRNTKPTILYDTDTGVISFDIDGTGARAKVEFIQLMGIPELHGTDFHVF